MQGLFSNLFFYNRFRGSIEVRRVLGAVLPLEMVMEKDPHPLGGVFCVGWAVATFIIGVFEGVAGIGINLHVDRFAQ